MGVPDPARQGRGLASGVAAADGADVARAVRFPPQSTLWACPSGALARSWAERGVFEGAYVRGAHGRPYAARSRSASDVSGVLRDRSLAASRWSGLLGTHTDSGAGGADGETRLRWSAPPLGSGGRVSPTALRSPIVGTALPCPAPDRSSWVLLNSRLRPHVPWLTAPHSGVFRIRQPPCRNSDHSLVPVRRRHRHPQVAGRQPHDCGHLQQPPPDASYDYPLHASADEPELADGLRRHAANRPSVQPRLGRADPRYRGTVTE